MSFHPLHIFADAVSILAKGFIISSIKHNRNFKLFSTEKDAKRTKQHIQFLTVEMNDSISSAYFYLT